MPRGSSPKIYAPDIVERVRDLYASGMTQAEVASEIGSSQKVVWNLMRRHGIAARIAAKRDQWGDKNTSWKGDLAGYQALHCRLYSKFGKPRQCSTCGATDPARSYDYASLTGRYADMEDYAPMCRSCHWKLDRKIFNIRHMRKEGSRA